MEAVFSLTPEQRAEFERAGMLRLPGYFPLEPYEEMAARLWAFLAKGCGAVRDRPESWSRIRAGHFQALIKNGVFDVLGPWLTPIADALIGKDAWVRPAHFGQPLVTPPMGRWDVPHNVWHLDDLPSKCTSDELPSVRVFTFLEPVHPRGGGTCYVEGSHRVAIERAAEAGGRVRSVDMKKFLAREEPWFAALFDKATPDRIQRFMLDEGCARGVPVRVKEVAGEPGDAWIMHPAMLHTISPNGLDRVRVMLVQAFSRARANGE